ncbi:MAG: hypothetical protein ACRDNH_02965 [Gaiellaceae bacterium]
MRERFARRAWLGLVAGVATAFAVGGFGPVASAVSPSGESAAAKQYADKVTICHRTGSKKKPFHTIRVSRNALKAHLKHGDTVGPCGPNSVFTMCAKTKNGAKKTMKVKGTKKAARALKKGAKLGKCKAKGKPEKGKSKGKEKQKGHGKKKGGGPKKP